MKQNISDSAVFKFYSLDQPFRTGESVSPNEIFSAYGRSYFFEKGGVIESIFEDPENPIQEPKMCVRIRSI
jgi:hypothetical protein